MIKPIKNKKSYAAALARIEVLFDAKSNTPAGDELEILVTLVEAYELKHFAIDAPDPVAAIEYWMESRGLARRDLASCLGGCGKVSEILNRKRSLSLNMIRKLHAEFAIPADLLINDVRVSSNTNRM